MRTSRSLAQKVFTRSIRAATLLLFASNAVATSSVHYSVQRLIEEADLIVVGTVQYESLESIEIVESPDYQIDNHDHRYALFHIEVERTLKGGAPETLIPIRSYCCVSQNCRGSIVCGTPFLNVGEKYILFVRRIEDGKMAVVNQLEGKLKFSVDLNNDREILLDDRGHEIVTIDKHEWVELPPPRVTQETQHFFTMRDDGFLEADMEAFEGTVRRIDHGTITEIVTTPEYDAARNRQEVFETHFEQWELGADAVIPKLEKLVHASE